MECVIVGGAEWVVTVEGWDAVVVVTCFGAGFFFFGLALGLGVVAVLVVADPMTAVCVLVGVEEPHPAITTAARMATAVVPVKNFISIDNDASPGEYFPAFMLGAVHIGDLTPSEQRVLGCLIEKRWTTPEQYPLSLNALRLAANQSTNRDPVTDYDDAAIREAAERLSRYGLARLATGHGSRTTKYRHLAEDALSLGRQELSALCVLLLRGPQTPGELKARTERMASFESLQDVERALGVLGERGYARRVDRRPGQKEDRFEHLMGAASATTAGDPVDARLTALESEVASLRAEVSALRGAT